MSLPLTAVRADPRALTPLIRAMQAMMAGQTSILPLPATGSARARNQLAALMRVGTPIAAGTLIACTSGSTGTPKGAMLSAANLRASGQATTTYLQRTFPGAKPGAWLLALPPHHIAGLQVILRSLSAGFTPLVATHLRHKAISFSAETFLADTHQLRKLYPGCCLYTSLVPAQVQRLAAHPQAREALRYYTAILVGGAATHPALVKHYTSLRLPITYTYGSSETAGGAVYDGIALPGVHLSVTGNVGEDAARNTGEQSAGSITGHADDSALTTMAGYVQSHRRSIQPAQRAGRVIIRGPMVASGYRNAPHNPNLSGNGAFTTSDLGFFDGQRLHILGRSDEAINTGGYKVLPDDAEKAVLAHLPAALSHLTDICAVGIPHPVFGHAIAVVLAPGLGAKSHAAHSSESHAAHAATRQGSGSAHPLDITTTLRSALRGALPPHLIPYRALQLPQLPITGPGKPDRQKIRALVQALE